MTAVYGLKKVAILIKTFLNYKQFPKIVEIQNTYVNIKMITNINIIIFNRILSYKCYLILTKSKVLSSLQ